MPLGIGMNRVGLKGEVRIGVPPVRNFARHRLVQIHNQPAVFALFQQ